MRQEFYEHKKSDRLKWIATLIAFLLLFVSVAGVFALGAKKSDWFEKTKELPKDETLSGAIIDVEHETSDIKLMSTRLMSSEYSENGVNPQADSAYTLTATITPTNATLKALSWTASWKGSVAWSRGKSISDYIAVTPSEDTLSATVECKAPFGAQAQITATFLGNAEVTAACTVDYRQKYQETFTGYFQFDTTDGKRAAFSNTSSTVGVDFPIADQSQLSRLGDRNAEISITPNGNDVYTLPMQYKLTGAELQLDSNMYSQCSSSSARLSLSHNAQSSQALLGVTYTNGICSGPIAKFMGIGNYSSCYVNGLKSSLYGMTAYYYYKLKFTVNGESKTWSTRVFYNKSSLGVAATGVDFSQGNMIF